MTDQDARREYLGDGAYCRLDLFGGIVLTAEDGITATDTIVLEQPVLKALENYISRMRSEELVR